METLLQDHLFGCFNYILKQFTYNSLNYIFIKIILHYVYIYMQPNNYKHYACFYGYHYYHEHVNILQCLNFIHAFTVTLIISESLIKMSVSLFSGAECYRNELILFCFFIIIKLQRICCIKYEVCASFVNGINY